MNALNTSRATLRFQLLVALCQGHIDLTPATSTDPDAVADFLCDVADRMASNLIVMAASDTVEEPAQ